MTKSFIALEHVIYRKKVGIGIRIYAGGKERGKVKVIAKDLLEKLNSVLVID